HHLSYYSPRTHLHLLSFPTRRSSDLGTSPLSSYAIRTSKRWQMYNKFYIDANILKGIFECFLESIINQCDKNNRNKCDEESNGRSEEHTSELQSRENLVCRLLLEKKK